MLPCLSDVFGSTPPSPLAVVDVGRELKILPAEVVAVELPNSPPPRPVVELVVAGAEPSRPVPKHHRFQI